MAILGSHSIVTGGMVATSLFSNRTESWVYTQLVLSLSSLRQTTYTPRPFSFKPCLFARMSRGLKSQLGKGVAWRNRDRC